MAGCHPPTLAREDFGPKLTAGQVLPATQLPGFAAHTVLTRSSRYLASDAHYSQYKGVAWQRNLSTHYLNQTCLSVVHCKLCHVVQSGQQLVYTETVSMTTTQVFTDAL